MIAVIDYGCGNLESLSAALRRLDSDFKIVSSPSVVEKADGIILPGVGNFGYAVEMIDGLSLRQPIYDLVRDGTPILGICLGMQLLFEASEEAPTERGLGLLEGSVVSLRSLGATGRIPHIGWNAVHFKTHTSDLLEGIDTGHDAYFVHSFAVVPKELSSVIATTEHGIDFTSVIEYSNVYGAQFHPEKSSAFGAAILRNFLRKIC